MINGQIKRECLMVNDKERIPNSYLPFESFNKLKTEDLSKRVRIRSWIERLKTIQDRDPAKPFDQLGINSPNHPRLYYSAPESSRHKFTLSLSKGSKNKIVTVRTCRPASTAQRGEQTGLPRTIFGNPFSTRKLPRKINFWNLTHS